jgi:hypothetical protein
MAYDRSVPFHYHDCGLHLYHYYCGLSRLADARPHYLSRCTKAFIGRLALPWFPPDLILMADIVPSGLDYVIPSFMEASDGPAGL